MIGSNIGAGPDILAEALTGEEGMKILDAAAAQHGVSKDKLSMGLVNRSMNFDAKWCEALDDGCKQFVILAAGLDARAWRLPRMDKSVKVFEVDVPRAFRYKEERLKSIDVPLKCERVAVEADLSDPNWSEQLLASGFDPSQRSFFLIEGLLMYLPPGAPEALLGKVATLMSAGSTITGDTFVGSLAVIDQRFVRSLGTKWTFDFESDGAIKALLASHGLEGTTIEAITNSRDRASDKAAPESTDGYAASKARALQEVLLGLGQWPDAIVEMTLPKILTKGDAGVRALVEQVVQDALNFHQMRDAPAELKAEIAALILQLPLEGAPRGSADFSEALQAVAKELAQSRPSKPLLKRWLMMAGFAYKMWQLKRSQGKHKNSGAYAIYHATKAAQ